MSVIFTDTDCEMDYKMADELKLNVIGMPYTILGKESIYDFGKNTDIKDFYDKMRAGEVATTAALNSEDYLNYFTPVFERGEDIIYIHFSSELSGTFNYMQTAINILKEKFPQRKITCFDTKNISVGAGIQVIEATKLHNAGASDEEVFKFLTEFKDKIAVYFYVDSLKYLKRGGRISASSALFGTVLNVKPILTVSCEGKLEKLTTVRGNQKALNFLFDKFEKQYAENENYSIYILDADNQVMGDKLAEKIKGSGKKVDVVRLSVGPVVGAHCGPGTIGMIFVKN